MYSEFQDLPVESAREAVANLTQVEPDRIRVTSTDFKTSGSKVGDGMTSVVKVVRISYQEEGKNEVQR